MCDRQHARENDVLHITTRQMKAAQAKWDRLTTADLAGIRAMSQLIGRVEERYSLPHDQAARDVELWASDKQF
jgi:hypothetical protein